LASRSLLSFSSAIARNLVLNTVNGFGPSLSIAAAPVLFELDEELLALGNYR